MPPLEPVSALPVPPAEPAGVCTEPEPETPEPLAPPEPEIPAPPEPEDSEELPPELTAAPLLEPLLWSLEPVPPELPPPMLWQPATRAEAPRITNNRFIESHPFHAVSDLLRPAQWVKTRGSRITPARLTVIRPICGHSPGVINSEALQTSGPVEVRRASFDEDPVRA